MTELDHLEAGARLVNDLFALSLPSPSGLAAWAEPLSQVDPMDVDRRYRLLLCALLGKSPADSDDALMLGFPGLLGAGQPELSLEPCFPFVAEVIDLSDEELSRRVDATFHVRTLTWPSVFPARGFVFAKVNHVHWEYVAALGLASQGKRSLRPLDLVDDAALRTRFQRSRVDDLVVRAIARLSGAFDTAAFSLGISFNNGDGPLADDYQPPLSPITRGAMAGAYGFFRGRFPATSHRLSDGAFPKRLVWEQTIDPFFNRVIADGERAVFICPPHLRGIHLRGRAGHCEVIEVPPTCIHEYWPSVLAVVLSRLAAIFQTHSRVTVFCQAGLMSVPLAVAVQQMRAAHPATRISFFDFGQALDVATWPKDPQGTWLRQPWLQETLQRSLPFPLALKE